MKRTIQTLAVLATLALGFGLAAPAGAAPAMAARAVPAADAAQPAAEQAGYHGPRPSIHFHFGTPAPQFYHVPPQHRSQALPRAHVNWCHARYRSYRVWDNTFQPHRGPRRQCISPFF
jgi:hypothetical protein